MCSKCTISVLLLWQLSAILAQQACYWPSGSSPVSSEAELMNCYSSQPSACCTTGDMCMSNGLCIAGNIGIAYRGGCTDRTWANTTACPSWCLEELSTGTATIYPCPGTEWYTCAKNVSAACMDGDGTGNFQTYTSATILGTPPLSSTEKIATETLSTEQITTAYSGYLTMSASVTKSAASITLTNQPTCTEIIHQTSRPATAIGVGLGVPFGIAAIGFLVFLFWRDARGKNARDPKQNTSRNKKTRRHNTLAGGEMDGSGLRLELQGSIINPELYGSEII